MKEKIQVINEIYNYKRREFDYETYTKKCNQ